MNNIRQEIIDFICKADWEGGYINVIDQWNHMVPKDADLVRYADQINRSIMAFEDRLKYIAEQNDVDVSNPYLYEEEW